MIIKCELILMILCFPLHNKISYAQKSTPSEGITIEKPTSVAGNLSPDAPEDSTTDEPTNSAAPENSTTVAFSDTTTVAPTYTTKVGYTGTIPLPSITTPIPEKDIEEVESEIDDLLNNITSNSNINQEDWSNSLRSIHDLVLSIVNQTHLINRTLAESITNSSLDVLNMLIEKPLVWTNLSKEERTNSTSNIFKIVHNLSVLMNAKQDQLNPGFTSSLSSIVFQSKLFRIKPNESVEFVLQNVKLELPFLGLINVTTLNETQIALTAVVLKNLTTYLSFGDVFVNSDAISLVVQNQNNISLKDGHQLTFVSNNLNRLEFGDKPNCAYWEFSSSSWSNKGCQYNRVKSNRSHTVCECAHLTNFAALMDISHREGPSLAKSCLTYVCSSLTCIFLLLALYVSLKYNRETPETGCDYQFKVKSNKFTLNLNITIWLLISHLIILFGMDLTMHKFVCNLVSVTLLFSLLTTFSFTLMLCVHLYISVSKKFLLRFTRLAPFVGFGYGFPVAIIVGSVLWIWAIETSDVLNSFSGEYFCWISSNDQYPNHIWIFVGPATCIIIANLCILICLVQKVRKSRKESKAQQNVINFVSILLLMFNFGIPWILYILYINEYFQHFSYVFIVVNGTQGIVLFGQQYLYYRTKQRRRQRRREA